MRYIEKAEIPCIMRKDMAWKAKLDISRVSATNEWDIVISNTRNYRNFSRVEIWFFSVLEIPIKHSSLSNNRLKAMLPHKVAVLFVHHQHASLHSPQYPNK